MKRFLKWTATIAGIAIGGTLAYTAIQAARRRVKDALAEAESIADRTRVALEETESALHSIRRAI